MIRAILLLFTDFCIILVIIQSTHARDSIQSRISHLDISRYYIETMKNKIDIYIYIYIYIHSITRLKYLIDTPAR
jgi:hypothetical protein